MELHTGGPIGVECAGRCVGKCPHYIPNRILLRTMRVIGRFQDAVTIDIVYQAVHFHKDILAQWISAECRKIDVDPARRQHTVWSPIAALFPTIEQTVPVCITA